MTRDTIGLPLAMLAIGALLAGCQAPGVGRGLAGAPPEALLLRNTPAAWAQATFWADQFDADFNKGGMTGVGADIERCYAMATESAVAVLPLRQCMVFDTFVIRFNAEANRINPGIGDRLAYDRPHAYRLRMTHYAPLAGFTDSDVLAGYMAQGSSSIFSVLAARTRR